MPFLQKYYKSTKQAAGSLQMMLLWGDCGGTGVAIVVIMEEVMELQGWRKW